MATSAPSPLGNLWKPRLQSGLVEDPKTWLQKRSLPNMTAAASALDAHNRNMQPLRPPQGNQAGSPAPMGGGPPPSAPRLPGSGGLMGTPSAAPLTGMRPLQATEVSPARNDPNPPARTTTSVYQDAPSGWSVPTTQLSGPLRPAPAANAQVAPGGTDTLSGRVSSSTNTSTGVGTSTYGLGAAPQPQTGVGTSTQGLASSTPTSTASTEPASTEPDYTQPSDRIGEVNPENAGDWSSPAAFQASGMSVQDLADTYEVDPGWVQSLLDEGFYIDEDGYAFRSDGTYVGDIEDIRDNDGGLMTSRYSRWLDEKQKREAASTKTQEDDARRKAFETLTGGLDRIDNFKGLDPALLQEMLATQRAERGYAISKNRNRAMQAAASQGLSGAAAQGYGAEVALPAELAGASQDAQAKLSFAVNDMQQRSQQLNMALQQISQIASLYAGTAEGDRALAMQTQLMEYKQQLDMEMATFMQRFQPTFLEQALGGLFGVIGTAGGTLAGTYAGRKL